MSKRHQSNRRKAYGRRQHEVLERRGRDQQPEAMDLALGDRAPVGIVERFAFLDRRMPPLRYAMGD